MKVAENLVKCLEEQGVKYIFGVPGEENIDLLDALKESNINFIVCHHETSGAFIAGIMGKLTGQPGVCLSTLGPGATNMITGVACATLDSMPLIAITAQTDTIMQRVGTHQYLNVIGLYSQITKSNTSIRNGIGIQDIVAESFSAAVSDRPGAIHIELPNDIASLSVPETSIPPIQSPRISEVKKSLSERIVNDVAMEINKAKYPLVFIGSGAVNEASSVIKSFIEKLKSPFTETYMAKGVVPENHPLHLQTIGLPTGDYVNKSFEYTDLVITIGYDSVEYGAQKWNKGFVPIIHINSEGDMEGSSYPVKASLIGNISENLQLLSEQINQREDLDSPFSQLKEVITNDTLDKSTSEAFPMKPQRIIKDIQTVLSGDDILISDVGAHKHWIGRQYEALLPNRCIISNGLASMGIALPGAIGAKIAFPDKKVMAVCGDGSFIMSFAEFGTAVRLKLPIVIMVWRDGRYGAIEWEQVEKLGRSSNIQFDNPDFVALAKAYGAKGYRVGRASEIVQVLKKAFSEDGPVIVECPVDYTENFQLSERLRIFNSSEVQ